MDRERLSEIVNRIKLNQEDRYKSPTEENICTVDEPLPDDVGIANEPVPEDDVDDSQISENTSPSNSEIEFPPDDDPDIQRLEKLFGDKSHPENPNNRIAEALLGHINELGITGKVSSIVFTLLYLLKMNPEKAESQSEIAEKTSKSLSTVERHIKYLRENQFIETETFNDATGTRTKYKFEGLKDKLRAIGIEV